VGERKGTDESDSIAEIIGVKGGEAPDIFRLRQLSKKDCFVVLMLNWECLFAV
jgi:hypothetical protein